MRVRYRILVAAPSRAWARLVGKPGQRIDSGCCCLPPTTQPLTKLSRNRWLRRPDSVVRRLHRDMR